MEEDRTKGGDASGFSSEVLRRLAGRGPAATRYRMKGEVAHGGMGAILRVWDEDLRRHLAMKVDQKTQDGIRDRLAAAGITAPDTYILNHGYCYSLYVFDPAKLLIEFTVDDKDVDKINAEQKAKAHSELKRWLAGNHAPNNEAYHR